MAQHGAKVILRIALKNEIDEYTEKVKSLRYEEVRRLGYQNGYHREREIQTGIGSINVEQTRVEFKSIPSRTNTPKRVKSLTKDAEELLTFYDFPTAHFQHIKTTNPIESSFSTIGLRTKKMRNCGNRKTTLAMLYKLSQQVEKGWRKLRGYKEIPYVLEGMPYLNGSRMENVVG